MLSSVRRTNNRKINIHRHLNKLHKYFDFDNFFSYIVESSIMGHIYKENVKLSSFLHHFDTRVKGIKDNH